jgi:hypothetical protein
MAAQTNFELFRGTATILRFQLTNPELMQDDPTTWTTLFVVRKGEANTNTVLSIAGTISTEANAAEYGIFDVDVTKANTNALTAGVKYAYSFRRTDTGFEDLLAFGELRAKEAA